jgi:4-diphosphocytidyl-2-C-methyl-D-erythritol kinase
MAPAKLNLTLEVLGKRDDGFHEIRSVIQTISLSDRLSFQPASDTTFKCNMPGWMPELSLVSRAVSLLRETTGITAGVTIDINKVIPLMSGLGGDSSDAAAILLGLDKLWGPGLSREKLTELAQRLGSDVGFFLCGGTALIEGRGEMIIPLPSLARRWIVLVVPDLPRQPGKTERTYASLNGSHFTDGRITARMVEQLKAGGGDLNPSLLFNTFENLAFARLSEIEVYRQHILKLGADNVHLAGSGPSLFSVTNNKDRAKDLFIRCRQQGMESYLAETADTRS